MAEAVPSRTLALGGLALLLALFAAVHTGQPPTVRLPLTLAVFLLVPGLAVANVIGVERSAAWLTLVVAASLASTTVLSAALSLLGALCPEVVVTSLVACCAPPLALQAVGRR